MCTKFGVYVFKDFYKAREAENSPTISITVLVGTIDRLAIIKIVTLATTLGAALEVTVIEQNVNVAQNVAKINCSKANFFGANNTQMQPNWRYIAQYGNTD